MKNSLNLDAIKHKIKKESKEDELILKMNKQLSNCEKNKNCVCNDCSDTKYDNLALEDLENTCGLNSEDVCIKYNIKIDVCLHLFFVFYFKYSHFFNI